MPTKTFYVLGESNPSNETNSFYKKDKSMFSLVKFRNQTKSNFPKDALKSKNQLDPEVSYNKDPVKNKVKEQNNLDESSKTTEKKIVEKNSFISELKHRFFTSSKDSVATNNEVVAEKQFQKIAPLANMAFSQSSFNPALVYDVVEQATHKVELKYKKFMIGVLSLFLVLILLNLYTVFSLNLTIRNTPVSSTDSTTKTPNLQEFKTPEAGLKIVREFAGSSALADVGFQLDIQKNQIKTKGSQNCKTNIIPPIENGCQFLLIPASLGIPSKGMIFKSISVETNLSPEDKIQVDLKNYDKDKIENIGTIDSDNQTKPISLPENIPSSSGILFRLWAKKQDITIKSISLRYFAVEDLKQVSGTLAGDLSKISGNGKIYFDYDSNSKFDKNIDKIWSCRPNFPGAIFTIKDSDKFSIEPDDGCFTDVKPDCWYKSKVDKCALPAGKWLLVLDDKDISMPFEVKDNTSTLKLSL